MNRIPILLVCLIVVSEMQSDLMAQTKNYFIYPQHLPFEKYKSSVGLGLTDLPEEQVEEASTFFRAPLFNYQAL